MRNVIRMYLHWQCFELVLVALLIPGLIFESCIANGWVYAGGSFAVPWVAAIGLLRGFFFEVLTYITARQAYLLCCKRNWFGMVLMAVVALAAMYVSSANNLGWVIAGHDLAGLFSTLGQVMGNGPMLRGYEFFLAVLLPVAVGAIALVPLDHFFQHALEQDHLDNHAVLVDERHMHRTAYLKAQRNQRKEIQQAYEEIAADRAQTFIDQARGGDLSFGAGGGVPQAALQLPAPGRSAAAGRVWPANRSHP